MQPLSQTQSVPMATESADAEMTTNQEAALTEGLDVCVQDPATGGAEEKEQRPPPDTEDTPPERD